MIFMYGSMVEKMTKGTKAKRNAYSAETGVESMQEYGLGGGTHNTYSGKSKRKKMNILTDVLSLIRRGIFAEKAGPDDVLVLGVNEEPVMTGIASPIPYKIY